MRFCAIVYSIFLLNLSLASDLSTHFFSSPAKDLLTSDNSCIGFYGCAGAPGTPQYCAITYAEDGKKILLKFYKYNYKNKNLELKNSQEISERLAADLLELLKEEVLNASDTPCRPVLDGWNVEFGIRQKQWEFAGTNTTDKKSVAFWMGSIGVSNDIDSLKEKLSQALKIKNDKAISEGKRTLVLPEGCRFVDSPNLQPIICQTKNAVWIINKTIDGNGGSKISLHRITKDFKTAEEIEIPIKTDSNFIPQNLHSLSDDTILFSDIQNNKAAVYKFNTESRKTEKIIGNLSSKYLQITPIGADKFIITNQQSGQTAIRVYSSSGEKLCAYEKRQNASPNGFELFSNPVLLNNSDIAVCFTSQTKNNKNDNAHGALPQEFESAVYIFTPDLKLKYKTDAVRGKAERCFEKNGNLFLLAQDGTFAKLKSSMVFYSFFMNSPVKVAEVPNFTYSFVINSATTRNSFLFFSPFELHSLNGNTGIFFLNDTVFTRKLPPQFDNVKSVANDETNIFIVGKNYLPKHKLSIYKKSLKSIFE